MDLRFPILDVMRGPDPRIHPSCKKGWVAGSSPATTVAKKIGMSNSPYRRGFAFSWRERARGVR